MVRSHARGGSGTATSRLMPKRQPWRWLSPADNQPQWKRRPHADPAALEDRYQKLFHFYDRDSDDQLTLEGDFEPVTRRLEARWGDRPTPFPHLLQLLLSTYAAENSRRDRSHSGSVDQPEFVNCHERVIAAYLANPDQVRAFIERSAGGLFDVLDLDGDGDGVLLPADLAGLRLGVRPPRRRHRRHS